MINRRLCVYDFETTGFWSPQNQPIEVAIKIIELDGKEINYHSYIKCPRPIGSRIEHLTKITDFILKTKGKDIGEVFAEINDLVNVPETLIIGHNLLTFDNLFMNHYLRLFGYKEIDKNYCFDTAGHFKGHLLQRKRSVVETFGDYHGKMLAQRVSGLKYRLIDACNYYGVEKLKAFHNAKADIDYTYEVYKRQVQDYDNAKRLDVGRLGEENRMALGLNNKGGRF